MYIKHELSLSLATIGLITISRKMNIKSPFPLPEIKPLITIVLMRKFLKRNETYIAIYLMLSSLKHRYFIGGLVLANLINLKYVSILSKYNSYNKRLVSTLAHCTLCGITICIWNRYKSWFGHHYQSFLDRHVGMSKNDINNMRNLLIDNKWWKAEDISYSKMYIITIKSFRSIFISILKLYLMKNILFIVLGKKISLKNSVISIFRKVIAIGTTINIGMAFSMIWAKVMNGIAPPKLFEYGIFCLASSVILIENNQEIIKGSSYILAQLIIGILKNNL